MSAQDRRAVPPWALVGLALVLVGAFGLRVWGLEAPSLWHDEGWSLRPLHNPLAPSDEGVIPPQDRLIPALQIPSFTYHYLNNTPPLIYGLLHVVWGPAGESEFALRYAGVLIDLLTVALIAGVLGRWGGRRAALIGAALGATAPLLWAYAREFRPYMVVPLFALIVLVLAERLLRATQFPWRTLLVVLGVELALLYSHNLSVTVIGWLNLVVGAAWGWGRRWRWLGLWASGQGLLLALYLPWLAGQAPSGTPLNTLPLITPAQVWQVWQGYFAPLPWMIGAEDRLVIGSAALGVLWGVALVVLIGADRRPMTLLIVSQALLLPILSIVEMRAAHIDFHPRYTIAGVPAALMVLALAVSVRRRPPVLRQALSATAIVVGCGLGLLGIVTLKDTPRYQHDDFRALAAYYATLPPEALILVPYQREPALQDYYAERLGVRAQVLGLRLHSAQDEAVRAINAALAQRSAPVHVELVTWYQLPADLRGMLPCLLEAAGQRLGARTVQGLTTTAYRVERPLGLVTEPVQAEYEVLTLTGSARGGQGVLCLRTDWTLTRETEQDWRVSARLMTTDPPGWVIVQGESDIRRADQLPTSDWKPGAQGAAFNLLRFPPGAPPGDYAVQLVVFSAQAIDGVDRLVRGVPAGRVFSLEPVSLGQVVPGPLEALPHAVAAEVDEGVHLRGHDAAGGRLSAGQELRITLAWACQAAACARGAWSGAVLTLHGEGWDVTRPVRAYGPDSLDWHSLRVSPEASGPATLSLVVQDGTAFPLARYTVEQTERLLTPPPVTIPVQTEFVGVAVLEGITVEPLALTPEDTLALTLVWRALAATDLSYRVFTHLLDAGGRVIAQHDGYPVAETRPTTGWVASEYLLDVHTLVFDPRFRTYRGPARLEVGFYDPATNYRVPLANGADHVLLPVTIEVH